MISGKRSLVTVLCMICLISTGCTKESTELLTPLPEETQEQADYEMSIPESQSDWYGFEQSFPFDTYTQELGPSVTDEDMVDIAYRYYTYTLNFGIPDCWLEVKNSSNYPQFNYDALHDYRWCWLDEIFDQRPREPKAPQPYSVPISIAVSQYSCEFYDACDESLRPTFDADMEEWLPLQARWASGHVDAPFFHISGLCLMNGDSRTEDDYFRGSRAKTIQVSIDNEYEKQFVLQDTPSPQYIDLDYTQKDISKPVEIVIEVFDSYQGEDVLVYITEIGIGLQSNLLEGHSWIE